MKHWTPADLAALRRLRERFLTGTAGAIDYWRSPEDLALYDATLGERIGWKWDAVLRELGWRGWSPQSRQVLDWGCGSGIAGRRVLAAWPKCDALALHDRSLLAVRFAAERARAAFPQVRVKLHEAAVPDSLLLVSHVLNELAGAERERLLKAAREAAEIIWVEAGTHADSRALSAVRDQLLPEGFRVIAPCTHQARCGMLVPKNERHWCHHFAEPPPAAFQDGRWAELGRELGIDLRSLPYSFLVLSRLATPMAPGFSRVIGEPRDAKGYSKVLSCHADGVGELMLQKRDAPDLLRTLRKALEAPIYRWTLEAGKITAGEPLARRE
ncbi:MAG: hypothetical protein QOE70_1205 [Chthoniobacter sp.]|jgi:ribosomal protein RSM22 (predicted rRNA methylase)|nr:hypothetical protein [Chthoniobacter sp.]